MKRYIILLCCALMLLPLTLSCKRPSGQNPVPYPEIQPEPQPDPEPSDEPEEASEYIKVDEAVMIHAMNLSHEIVDGIDEYSFTTTAADPYFHLETLKEKIDLEHYVLSFEYQLNAAKDLQIYYCTPGASEPKSKIMNIAAASSWTRFTYDMEADIAKFGWGEAGHRLRLDIGNEAGIKFSIRKIYIRRPTEKEKADKEKEMEGIIALRHRAASISDYLSAQYDNAITNVKVEFDKIRIDCKTSGSGLYLVEIMPSADITDKYFPLRHELKSGTVTLDRYENRDGLRYDRALSRWAIVKPSGSNEDKILSHARYADELPCASSMAEVKMKSKKGLGGFFGPARQIQDLDDLQISSVTVNVTPLSFTSLTSSGSCYTHNYCGTTYYFDRAQIDNLDKNLKECQKRGIVVGAIILIQRTAAKDQKVAQALIHPDCNGGNYSMPNMTSTASIHTYAAILDFLASRYSPADGTNGSIHNWIMHNEVDAALTWTNMGDGLPEMIVTNEYEKSMRMCYNIARQYYPHAKVLASFTHTWTEYDNADGYTAKSMLGDLVRFSSAEGDYEWGIAAHPYPQNLLEPRLWSKDTKATYSMNSGFVTFKNLEVLDKWVKTPANMYQGKIKRALWLSENGTNSRSYSESDLADQAAGAAWAWKKVQRLDGIDGIQWHNWFDHPTEVAAGLRIGLRDSNQNAKPVWYLYKAAGTADESSTFAKYLSVIGISSWDEIHHNVD